MTESHILCHLQKKSTNLALTEPKRLTCMLSMHAGGEQPIPLWNEHDTSTDADKPQILLYSVSLMFKVCHTRVSFSMEIQSSTFDTVAR